MVFLFALNQLRSLNDMRILTKAFIVVGLLVASYGYYEFASAKLDLPYVYPSLEGYDFEPHAAGVDLSFEGVSIPRIYSTFGEPKVLGNFLLVPIFLSLSHWTSKKKAIHLFMSAYLAGALILTFSTTAWLGLIVGSVVWVVLLGRGHLRQMLGLAGPIVVLAAASLIIVALLMPDSGLAPIRLMDYHLQRIIKIPTGSAMVADDYIIGWRSGWGLFTSSPILGVGIGNSPFYMLGIRTTFAGVIDHVFTPFNLFILILSETGVLGFAPFIALIAIPSLRAIRSIRTSTGSSVVAYERAILVGALAAFAGSMVTYAAFGGARFFIEEWLVLALLARGAQLVTSRSLASQQA
jgi:O-antigen ligase